MPTYLTLAEHDRIIDNARTRAICQRFRGPLTIQEYPGAHHTLEFEPADHPWLADVMSWIEKQL